MDTGIKWKHGSRRRVQSFTLSRLKRLVGSPRSDESCIMCQWVWLRGYKARCHDALRMMIGVQWVINGWYLVTWWFFLFIHRASKCFCSWSLIQLPIYHQHHHHHHHHHHRQNHETPHILLKPVKSRYHMFSWKKNIFLLASPYFVQAKVVSSKRGGCCRDEC